MRAPDIVQWKQIVWNPLFRRMYANPERLPEGNLNVCVRVYEWKNGKGAKLAEACEKTFVNYADNPKITKPADETHITDMPVTFSWQKIDAPEYITVHYTIDIAEIPQGGSAEAAFSANPVYLGETDGTEFTLKSDAMQLRRGATYVWRVTAFDQYGNPATAHNGISRTGKFYFDQLSDFQKQRALAIAKKTATDLLSAALNNNPAPQMAFVKNAKDKLSTASSAYLLGEIAKELSGGLDSLAVVSGMTTAAFNNIITAAFALRYVADINSGKYIMAGTRADSLLALSIAYAEGLGHIGGEGIRSNAQKLAQVMTTIRSSLGTVKGHSSFVDPLESFASLATSASSDVETVLQASSQNAYAGFLHTKWNNGGYIADALFHALKMEKSAPKNLQSSMLKLVNDLLSAAKSDKASDVQSAQADAESAKQAKGASAISADLDAIEENISASLQQPSTGNKMNACATIASMLKSSEASVSKKNVKQIDALANKCQSAGNDPASQLNVLNDIKSSLPAIIKNEKQTDALQTVIEKINGLTPSFSQTAVFTQTSDIATQTATSMKDKSMQSVCDSIAVEASSAARPLTPREALRIAQNIIRDARAFDALNVTAAGNAKLADQITPALAEKIILPDLLIDPSFQEMKHTLDQKNITLNFATTATGAYIQMMGGQCTLDISLAIESPVVLQYFISAALNTGAAHTLYGIYQQDCTGADALDKNNGFGFHSRTDAAADEKILGEQETKRMFRALPEYETTADH